jgi:hypothetical protein
VLNPADPDVRRSFKSFRIISSWLYQKFAPRNQAFESSKTWCSVVGTVDFSTSPPHFTGLLFSIGLTKISRATKHSTAKLLVSLRSLSVYRQPCRWTAVLFLRSFVTCRRLLIEKRWRSLPRPATLHSHSGLYKINPQRSTVEESSTSTNKQFCCLSSRSLATLLPLQYPTSSPSQPKPPMSLESYLAECPNQISWFNKTGMSGLVCATPARPGILDITNCCSGKYRVEGNCVQICESRPDLEFGNCVNSGTSKNGSGFHAALCVNTSASLAVEPSSSSSSSSGDGGDTGKESGAGEFIHVSLWRLRGYELTDRTIFQLRDRAGPHWVTRFCSLRCLLSLLAWLLTSSAVSQG